MPNGYFEDADITPATPETRVAIRDSVDALRRAGFRVEPFKPRTLEAARKLWWMFFVRCGYAFDEEVIQGQLAKLSPTFRGFMDIAQAEAPLGGKELLFAWAELDVVRAK